MPQRYGAGQDLMRSDARKKQRRRTERERGIPTDYEPGQERSDAYFMPVGAARTAAMTVERADGRVDVGRLERAEQRRREGNRALSRGYGGGGPSPATPLGYEERYRGGVSGRGLMQGATHAVKSTRPGTGAMTREVPGELAGWGQPGLEGLAEGEGFVRLRGGQARDQGRELMLAGSRQAFLRGGTAGVRAYKQAGGGAEGEAALTQTVGRRVMGLPEAPAGQLGAERAAPGLAVRGAEAGVEAAEAQAKIATTQATAWAGALEAGGPEGLIAAINGSDPMEGVGMLNSMAAQATKAGDELSADWFRRAAIAKSGGQVIEVPDPGIIERWTNFINSLFGTPWRVDFGGRKQAVVPAGGAAVMGGGAAQGGAPAPAAGGGAGPMDQNLEGQSIEGLEEVIKKIRGIIQDKKRATPG
ncbi:MAG TPA: hypothetical protein VMY35_12240 [Phycisphaerae bacterium]|nr:hypothetical protein [Phycisphaerae bacterium]